MMIATFSLAGRAAALSLALAAGAAAMPAAPQANVIADTEIVGTAFRITLSSGRVLQGTALEGATLSLPGDPTPRRLRLDRIVPVPATRRTKSCFTA